MSKRIHVELPSGAMAKVSSDVSRETLEALDRMAVLAGEQLMREKARADELDDLNERVALAMGWHYREDPEQSAESYWTLPDGGKDDAPPFGTPHTGHYGDFYTLPDFARDPMALGYLVGYLARTETPFQIDGSEQDNPGPLDFNARLHSFRRSFGFYATPGEALARAIVHYAGQ